MPLRIEVGPKDVQQNACVTARRDKPGEPRSALLGGVRTACECSCVSVLPLTMSVASFAFE